MSTEQSYVGRGNNAPISPQKDATASKSPFSVDNRPPTIPAVSSEHKKAKQNKALRDLLIATNGIGGLNNGLTDHVDALTTIITHWILTEYKTQARENDDADLAYYDQIVTAALSTIEFVVDVTQKRGSVSFFELLVDGEKEKEVNNG